MSCYRRIERDIRRRNRIRAAACTHLRVRFVNTLLRYLFFALPMAKKDDKTHTCCPVLSALGILESSFFSLFISLLFISNGIHVMARKSI